jgi:hypothetical protein
VENVMKISTESVYNSSIVSVAAVSDILIIE